MNLLSNFYYNIKYIELIQRIININILLRLIKFYFILGKLGLVRH
jgi:hypothetical protein